jgi:calcium/calmodulin-dependent protein kinase (CaM kinase) II
MPSAEEERRELLALTQRLLDCIAAGDWQAYSELCDPSLTCFEPESCGELVTGMAFHRFYFDLHERCASSTEAESAPAITTIVAPHVRILGDAAVVSYVRLVQRAAGGAARTVRFEETRVWQRHSGRWRHVHFHRSAQAAPAS